MFRFVLIKAHFLMIKFWHSLPSSFDTKKVGFFYQQPSLINFFTHVNNNYFYADDMFKSIVTTLYVDFGLFHIKILPQLQVDRLSRTQ